jgi:sugar lactone lactonase YvrE
MTELTTLIGERTFLEGPRWHDGALWVSDMYAGEVLRVTLDGAVETVARVPGRPSGLGWRPDGALLVVSMLDRRLLRRDAAGTVDEVADLSRTAPHEINDMVVDRRGHAFISQFGFDFHGGASYRKAPLLRVDPDGTVVEATDPLRFANGLVVTRNGCTLVVAESTGKDLVAFDLAPTGELTNQRVWAELPDYPDGICIDGADGIWIASPPSDRCVRVEEGGAVTDVVEVLGRHTIACAIGGDDGRTLFVCTSPTHGEPDKSRDARGARVEMLEVAVAA